MLIDYVTINQNLKTVDIFVLNWLNSDIGN